jgi:hypothetical protein
MKLIEIVGLDVNIAYDVYGLLALGDTMNLSHRINYSNLPSHSSVSLLACSSVRI